MYILLVIVQMCCWEHMCLSVCVYTLATCFQWEVAPMLAVSTEVLEDNFVVVVF